MVTTHQCEQSRSSEPPRGTGARFDSAFDWIGSTKCERKDGTWLQQDHVFNRFTCGNKRSILQVPGGRGYFTLAFQISRYFSKFVIHL